MTNWTSKYKYLVAELARYEGYIDTLKDAIALRIKKQGEKKFEKSLARSTTSLHGRDSVDDVFPILGIKNGSRGRKGPLSVEIGEKGHLAEEITSTPVQTRRS